MSREIPVGPPDDRAAREGLAHRFRPAAILDVEGADRVAFLHGQLTQDVRGMAVGQTRATAGLTPKGKLLFVARLQMLPDRLRLLLPAASRASVLAHLQKYAAFQKVSITDSSDALLRIGLYGPGAARLEPPVSDALLLPADGEFSRELVLPTAARGVVQEWLDRQGSVAVSEETAQVLRVEAGRPRFGTDADESNLADEVGLEAAISTTKGCYVGQEIVARMRTYGRVNRRLVGLRFPQGAVPAGEILKRPEEAEAGKVEMGRVTSSVPSPKFGPIGLGFAFRDVAAGDRLISVREPARSAIVVDLPFA